MPLYFLIVRVPWRWARMQAFLDPFKDPQGKGFHIIQSMIAVSTGGLTGLGLMEGKQKLFYLPEPHTDFIFAVTAEELGLWGSLLVVGLFGIFLYRGIRTALRTSDMFGKFLATGITAMVVVQALFNISVVLALVPAKGIPLPFISYGGSSLFITLASVGVLLNIIAASGIAMRVIVAGGGTGGHVIPALAIAQELRSHYRAEVVFVGTRRGIETRLVPAAGFELRLIEDWRAESRGSCDAAEDLARPAARR